MCPRGPCSLLTRRSMKDDRPVRLLAFSTKAACSSAFLLIHALTSSDMAGCSLRLCRITRPGLARPTRPAGGTDVVVSCEGTEAMRGEASTVSVVGPERLAVAAAAAETRLLVVSLVMVDDEGMVLPSVAITSFWCLRSSNRFAASRIE